eukprot:TRINITY_DN19030_c0_g1_i1.p1 TRINITY_DN19030_c0_g1~~TRINITY_DN19030_c0_g1_i1.p1  ORF type:complete len:221 (+),score=46.43 TRINITY_DN19030_c0_g1_i1:235-897(+)
MLEDMRALDCAVFGFNYPGVYDSTGEPSCAQALVDATVEVVEHLMTHHGYSPEGVVLKGHSLGGAVVSHTAAKLHRDGHPVCIFVGRSFADIASVVSTHAADNSTARMSVFSVAKAATFMTGWNLNSAAAYRTVPETHKMCINARDDQVIPVDASLCMEVCRDQNTCWFNGSGSNAHNVPLDQLHNDEGVSAEEAFRAFAARCFGSTPIQQGPRALCSML